MLFDDLLITQANVATCESVTGHQLLSSPLRVCAHKYLLFWNLQINILKHIFVVDAQEAQEAQEARIINKRTI